VIRGEGRSLFFFRRNSALKLKMFFFDSNGSGHTRGVFFQGQERLNNNVQHSYQNLVCSGSSRSCTQNGKIGTQNRFVPKIGSHFAPHAELLAASSSTPPCVFTSSAFKCTH